MKSVIVIHDTEARTFIVDRYNTQVVRDFVKSALETEFAFDGQDPKTSAVLLGSGEGRVRLVKISGKGLPLEKTVDSVLGSLRNSGNMEFETDVSSFLPKFYDFIRVSQDLPTKLTIGDEFQLAYDECDLKFDDLGVLIVHAPKKSHVANASKFFPLDVGDIDVADALIPLCIEYMNEVHKVQRQRFDRYVEEARHAGNSAQTARQPIFK